MKNINGDEFMSLAQQNKNMIVLFGTKTCEPCKQLKKKILNIKESISINKEMVYLDVTENIKIANQYNIRSVPTLISFRGAKPIQSITGNTSDAKIKSILGL